MPSPQTRLMPSKRRTRNPNWRDIYFAAVLESNERRALAKIQFARKVLTNRLIELQSCTTIPVEELRDLHSAVTYLDILFSCIAEDPPGNHMAAIA